MSKPLILPKFLTEEIATKAVNFALHATVWNTGMHSYLNRFMCHVVVIVPAAEIDDPQIPGSNWPHHSIRPHILFEKSAGKELEWPYPFDQIARSKGLQAWQDRNDDRTDIQPHLLFRGDTPFWGAVKRNGIVVACSGVQPHFDKLIAGITNDACVAFTHEAWLQSEDKKDDELCFVS